MQSYLFKKIIFFKFLHRFQDQYYSADDDYYEVEDSVSSSKFRVAGKLNVKEDLFSPAFSFVIFELCHRSYYTDFVVVGAQTVKLQLRLKWG